MFRGEVKSKLEKLRQNNQLKAMFSNVKDSKRKIPYIIEP